MAIHRCQRFTLAEWLQYRQSGLPQVIAFGFMDTTQLIQPFKALGDIPSGHQPDGLVVVGRYSGGGCPAAPNYPSLECCSRIAKKVSGFHRNMLADIAHKQHPSVMDLGGLEQSGTRARSTTGWIHRR